MKCPICEKGELKMETVEVEDMGQKLGTYKAEVCKNCGEKFFDERAIERMEKRAKELGIWGLARETKVGLSGSSLAIRIPKNIAKLLGIEKGTTVVIKPEGRKKLGVEVA